MRSRESVLQSTRGKAAEGICGSGIVNEIAFYRAV